MDLDYTSSELMAAAGARELRDGEIVAVGPRFACGRVVPRQEDARSEHDDAL